jgi:Tol biopolymer transport system component
MGSVPNVVRSIAFALALTLLVFGCTSRSEVHPTGAAGCQFGAPTDLAQPVNTGFFNGGPSLSADGLALYFASDRVGGYGKEDIWVSTRAMATAPFGPPTNLGPTVNSLYSDFAPEISADGFSLYLGSDRPGGEGGVDLWMAKRASATGPFGPPENLGPAINTRYMDDHPDITEDGLSLYLTSDRPGGSGDADLWVAARSSIDEPFGSPTNLRPGLNNASYDGEASISSDGLTLFFASDRPGGIGERDIWVATRSTTSAPFGSAKDLGRPINSSFQDATPDISGDGRTLYFLSDRPSSQGFDLWSSTQGVCAGSS